jgi:hypothetical protein
MPELLRLEGETRIVTCLSCGLRRYGALAQSFADDPVGFTRLINTAMAPLIEDAVGHGGMIGRFDGESFTPIGTRRSTIPNMRSAPAKRPTA